MTVIDAFSIKVYDKNGMMTSSNGNIFRATGHLCREFTSPWWIPSTKASDAEHWCFLGYITVEYTMVRLVIWDAILPIMMSQ